MSSGKFRHLVHAVPADWAERAHADASKYKEMYAFSASTPDDFGVITASE